MAFYFVSLLPTFRRVYSALFFARPGTRCWYNKRISQYTAMQPHARSRSSQCQSGTVRPAPFLSLRGLPRCGVRPGHSGSPHRRNARPGRLSYARARWALAHAAYRKRAGMRASGFRHSRKGRRMFMGERAFRNGALRGTGHLECTTRYLGGF